MGVLGEGNLVSDAKSQHVDKIRNSDTLCRHVVYIDMSRMIYGPFVSYSSSTLAAAFSIVYSLKKLVESTC
jgi:hypothetical protein